MAERAVEGMVSVVSAVGEKKRVCEPTGVSAGKPEVKGTGDQAAGGETQGPDAVSTDRWFPAP